MPYNFTRAFKAPTSGMRFADLAGYVSGALFRSELHPCCLSGGAAFRASELPCIVGGWFVRVRVPAALFVDLRVGLVHDLSFPFDDAVHVHSSFLEFDVSCFI